MKKIIALLLISIFLGLTGCAPKDPTKPAGPGGQRTQPYDRETGQYK